MVIEHSDRRPQRPHHTPLGGMKGRGVAEPPRDCRPRPRPPYPIPLKRRALQRCCSEGARQRLRRTRRHVPARRHVPLEVTTPSGTRSEEHTSELQSRGHLVCRLLLEKKKQKTPITKQHH